MAPGGIEPTTFALLARRSNQLSYGAIDIFGIIFSFPDGHDEREPVFRQDDDDGRLEVSVETFVHLVAVV